MMILVLKQKIFSLLDSYDICDSSGNCVFTVKSKFALGHCMTVYDSAGREVGEIKEKVISFLPVFEIYISGRYAGRIKKELTFFKPRFTLDCFGWSVRGDIMEWDYSVYDGSRQVMSVSKRLMHLSDTYEINVP
ncbi:MAG: LURP-one-related/scramblase family protein, partial [Oscillospiraceae bacterium]